MAGGEAVDGVAERGEGVVGTGDDELAAQLDAWLASELSRELDGLDDPVDNEEDR